jgi:hypothetical protein
MTTARAEPAAVPERGVSLPGRGSRFPGCRPLRGVLPAGAGEADLTTVGERLGDGRLLAL